MGRKVCSGGGEASLVQVQVQVQVRGENRKRIAPISSCSCGPSKRAPGHRAQSTEHWQHWQQTPTEQLIGCPADQEGVRGGAPSLAQSAGTTQAAGDNRNQTLKRESATIIGQRGGRRAGMQSARVRHPGAPVLTIDGRFRGTYLLQSTCPVCAPGQPSGVQ